MFSSKKKYETFEMTGFEVPCIQVDPLGKIIMINDTFSKKFKFVKEEILNQNVHILIPPKFMKKSNHEKLVSRYSYGKASAIVGSIRTLPMKNGDDEDCFMNIQIIPFLLSEKKGDFRFICFFHEIPINRSFDIEKSQETLLRCLETISPEETFRLDNEGVNEVCTQLKIYLNWEINLLATFIFQNKGNRRLSDMIRYFILAAPLGHLAKTRNFFTKRFKESEIAFLNAIALRLLFPILINNFKGIGTVLEGLKENLYKDHLDESGSSHSTHGNSARTK